jgi:hypothetical protein
VESIRFGLQGEDTRAYTLRRLSPHIFPWALFPLEGWKKLESKDSMDKFLAKNHANDCVKSKVTGY